MADTAGHPPPLRRDVTNQDLIQILGLSFSVWPWGGYPASLGLLSSPTDSQRRMAGCCMGQRRRGLGSMPSTR